MELKKHSPPIVARIWRALPSAVRLFLVGFIVVSAAILLSFAAVALDQRWLEGLAFVLATIGVGIAAAGVLSRWIKFFKQLFGRRQ